MTKALKHPDIQIDYRNPAVASRIIDELGGTCAMARLCGIKAGSICGWRKKGIPRPWALYLACLRPDLLCKPKRQRRNGNRQEG